MVLSVALRTSDDSGKPARVSWAGDSPAAALVVDIITACGGAADPPQGPILDARFFNLQSAMLATRRLVWGLEGLAETTHSTTAATIAIHSVEEGLTQTIAPALESLAQGEIVLSVRTAEMVRQLPGLILRDAPGGDWRELQWRSEEGKNLAADEQSVLGLIRALGREDPLAGHAETSAPTPPPVVAPTTGVFHASASLGRSLEEPETAPPFWKRLWVVVSAGAVVLILLAALIIPAMVSGNRSRAPVPDTTTKTAPPAPAPSAPSTEPVPPVQEKPLDEKPPVKPPRHTRPETKTVRQAEPPAPKTQPASCSLTEGEIPISLQRAENLMYAGKLPEAQSAFQRLVGCPSARDRAVDGLRQVRQRMAASPQ